MFAIEAPDTASCFYHRNKPAALQDSESNNGQIFGSPVHNQAQWILWLKPTLSFYRLIMISNLIGTSENKAHDFSDCSIVRIK